MQTIAVAGLKDGRARRQRPDTPLPSWPMIAALLVDHDRHAGQARAWGCAREANSLSFTDHTSSILSKTTHSKESAMLRGESEIAAVHSCDALVIGAGVSGYCAAIQAARCGCSVILLERDAVLGGNSGPNLGVGITGADRYNAFGTETGLIHELQEEAAWQDAFTHVTVGTMPYNISRRNEAVVQEKLVQAGARILKRHYARAPIVQGARIVGVIAEDLAAYRTVRVDVRHVVVEASGDGQIGVLAGADHDMGSEGKDEFGERSAPPARRSFIQGTSLVAIAQRTPGEVYFSPPSATPAFHPRVWQDSLSSFVEHDHDALFAGDSDLIFLYVTETGGHLDTIGDDAQIYEVLLGQLWAEWDHIKNGPHRDQARNWDLLWVSPKAGKRESRRLLGDYVLTQADLEEGRRFPDDIAYGGHDLDDHRPLRQAANIVAHSVPPMYGIPYRSCYSRNIDNLFLAGRLISATHLAHSSSRLMRTGGAIGQAVGFAAAICCEHGCTPRQVHRDHLDNLQTRLLRGDGTILGRTCSPRGDLARLATAAASSELLFGDQELGQLVPLIRPAGNVLWDWPETLDAVQLYLHNDSGEPQPLVLRVYRTHRRRKFKSYAEFHRIGWGDLSCEALAELGAAKAMLPAREQGWFSIPFAEPLVIGLKDPASDDDRIVIAVDLNPRVRLGLAKRRWEIAKMIELVPDRTEWSALRAMVMMRLAPEPRLGLATNAIDGFHRRFSTGPTHMWVSDPEKGLPQALELAWPSIQQFDTIAITFDNLTRYRHDTPWESGSRVSPHLVESYVLEARQDGLWREIIRENDNHHRFRTHELGGTMADGLRLRVLSTHGDPQCARMYQISVFSKRMWEVAGEAGTCG